MNPEKVAQTFIKLFDKIQHGDEAHRVWLREQIVEFANNIGIPIDESEMPIKEQSKDK